jgi:hypothetical protein
MSSSVVHSPKGPVSHICMSPANREPIPWERPEDSDIPQPRKPLLAFEAVRTLALGCTSPVAERTVSVSALLDRLPNLRLNPDAEPTRILGCTSEARPRSPSSSIEPNRGFWLAL